MLLNRHLVPKFEKECSELLDNYTRYVVLLSNFTLVRVLFFVLFTCRSCTVYKCTHNDTNKQCNYNYIRDIQYNIFCFYFQEQLTRLMDVLSNTNANFVRCIIPNHEKRVRSQTGAQFLTVLLL